MERRMTLPERAINVMNGAVGTVGTTLSVLLTNISTGVSIIAGVLTVWYMWNRVRISQKELRQMDD